MRIAVAQTCFVPASLEEAFRRLDELAAKARMSGAGLLMLPELFLCGYGSSKAARELALTPESAGFDALRASARTHSIGILTGFAEATRDGLYNAALLTNSRGEVLGVARKMHLWGDFERSTFRPGGRGPVVAFASELSAGILICYDLEHPVAAEDLARRGANLILSISATWAGYEVVPRSVLPARAYECGSFAAFSNHVGHAHGIEFAGLSTVVAPDGNLLAQAPADAEALLLADIGAAGYRPSFRPCALHVDRRTDLFPMKD